MLDTIPLSVVPGDSVARLKNCNVKSFIVDYMKWIWPCSGPTWCWWRKAAQRPSSAWWRFSLLACLFLWKKDSKSCFKVVRVHLLRVCGLTGSRSCDLWGKPHNIKIQTGLPWSWMLGWSWKQGEKGLLGFPGLSLDLGYWHCAQESRLLAAEPIFADFSSLSCAALMLAKGKALCQRRSWRNIRKEIQSCHSLLE